MTIRKFDRTGTHAGLVRLVTLAALLLPILLAACQGTGGGGGAGY